MDINALKLLLPPPIEQINLIFSKDKKINIDILRLDKIHPHISGNKFFKLKYNLIQAKQEGKNELLSFGGPYSNHLHALAALGSAMGIKTIAYIRGDKVENACLHDCKNYGMELHFISYALYKKKYDTDFLMQIQTRYPNAFIIPEGGNNDLGKKGCEEILSPNQNENYDLISCAMGTGTTVKGLMKNYQGHFFVHAPFKNKDVGYEILEKEHFKGKLFLQHDTDFGGFGKYNPALINYIEKFKENYNIALDFVYNAKTFYYLEKFLTENKAYDGKKILHIHTGGLQGNRSIFQPAL